jgi:hypothetical protein
MRLVSGGMMVGGRGADKAYEKEMKRRVGAQDKEIEKAIDEALARVG